MPAEDPRYSHIQDIGDVPDFDQREITHFFEVYKDLEPGKSVDNSHWEDRDATYAEIGASRARAAGMAGSGTNVTCLALERQVRSGSRDINSARPPLRKPEV